MTEEEQRMAIAKWCGTDKRTRMEWDNSGPGASHFEVPDVPDYLHDLNAMHEAEARLSDSQLDDYRFHLMQITQRHPRWSIKVDIVLAIKADATQRAEALLRTIGKWFDSPAKSACQPAISGTTVLL